jgi:TatD DNase family protein
VASCILGLPGLALAVADVMISYVDTHCHLDLFTNPVGALDNAPNTVVVAVTELPSRYRLLAARFRQDRRVRVALGLHPLRAASAGAMEEGLLVRHLAQAEYVGEVGLDYSKGGRDSKQAQLRIFERLLAEPSLRQKVVTVHSRGADRDVIERLRDAEVVAILHWYTGSPRLIDEALAAGLYFSINPAMLRTEKGRATIEALPTDRVLTETDGPFAKIGARTTTPHDIRVVVAALAKRWQSTENDARRLIHDNLASLYEATVGGSRKAPDPAKSIL